MKTKVIVMGLLATVIAGSVVAQENDDMYFNKKDRAKLNAKRSTEASYSSNYAAMSKTVDKMYNEDEVLNPTDSYSARNVNPEYVSRANSQQAKEDNGDYFLNNYQYNTASNLNQFNNNFNNWYNNPWYNTSYFGPSMYSSYNRPYGGYYYDSWNNPYMSPYYQNGYGMSYYNGSSWGVSCMNGGYGNYGYGNYGYGYGSGFGSYYSGWGSSFGMGMGWGWNYWNSPTVIVINNGGEVRGPVYGKRGTRGTNYSSSSSYQNSNVPNRSNYVRQTGSRSNDGGRISTPASSSNDRQEQYYQRTWRSSSPSRSESGSNSGRSFSGSNDNNDSGTRSSWGSGSSSGSRSYTPSNSGSSGSSGGSRSSGSSSGSSGSGSRSSRGH